MIKIDKARAVYRYEHDGGPKPAWLHDDTICETVELFGAASWHSRTRRAGDLGQLWSVISHFYAAQVADEATVRDQEALRALMCPHMRLRARGCKECEFAELQEMAKELRW